VIVVVGILVALQVSNWNQDRLERARADAYYRRIQADLVADRQSIDETLAFWKTVSAYGRAAIASGEGGQRVDGSNWRTVLAYYQASQLLPFQLEAGVVLDSYQHSEALLENLRFWMSTLGISSIVLDGARKDAVSLAADVDAARAK
jgi:hypothetical protein